MPSVLRAPNGVLQDLRDYWDAGKPFYDPAKVTVPALWPTTDGGRATGYGLYVGGRKFDSYVTTQGASSEVQTIDSGARFGLNPDAADRSPLMSSRSPATRRVPTRRP